MSNEAKIAAELMGAEEALKSVVLGKAISDAAYKGANGALPAGKYPVDITVHIKGSVTKGEEYDQKIVEKADAWGLLAVALSKLNGVTVEALVKEALAGGPDTAEVKEKANAAVSAVKGATWTKCTGKVTAKLTVTTEN